MEPERRRYRTSLRPPSPSSVTPREWTLALSLSVLLGMLLYLGASRIIAGRLGFPLDDAWIHQTYARNLAVYGQWSFTPGQPSTGSTAPLWTLLLALGYLLGIPFRLWTYGLGALTLVGTALLAARMGRHLFPDYPPAPWIAGLFCAVEWHLVWAAASGMETALFTFFSLLFLERALLWTTTPGRRRRRGMGSGQPQRRSSSSPRGLPLLGGLLILIRPEGIGLVALVVLLLAWTQWRQRRPLGRPLLTFAAILVLVLSPYLLFNLWVTGRPWPNTFYAKQAEYAVLFARFSFLTRLVRVALAPWTGAQVLLVPGFLYTLARLLRAALRGDLRAQRGLLPPLWAASLLLVYAWRLPVTYQHGRYQMPTIPIFLLYGVVGTLALLHRGAPGGKESKPGRQRLSWVLKRSLFLSLILLALLFWVVGAYRYGQDVAFIEGEMVTVAQWLNTHTAPEARIAVHDIGAIGYFTRRPLLDLAGLITPEVIPFIRDEARLADWLVQQQADYLVTFPSWYPQLVRDPRWRLVYQTETAITRQMGGDNMAVYQALRPDE